MTAGSAQPFISLKLLLAPTLWVLAFLCQVPTVAFGQDAPQPPPSGQQAEPQPASDPETAEAQPASDPEAAGTEPASDPEAAGTEPTSEPEAADTEPTSEPEAADTEPEPDPTPSPATPSPQGDPSVSDGSGESEPSQPTVREPVVEPLGEEVSAATLPPPDTAPPPPPQGMASTICEGRRIERIEVKGHGRVSADDVRATVKLRTGQYCTDRAVTQDVQALWDLGYFNDIRVEAEAVGKGSVLLTYVIDERPAIAEIAFDGNEELEDSSLEEKVTLRKGSVLSEPAVKRQLDKLLELYAEKGFFLAKVDYALDPLPNDQVRVRYVVDEGDEVAVRRIRFIGNENIDDSEIKRYLQTGETRAWSFVTSNNAYRREIFDQDLNTVQALYYDRGYLTVEVANPKIELSQDRRYIDLSIPIVEGPRYKVGRVRVAELDENGSEIDPLGGRKQLRQRVDLNPGDWFSRTTIAENLQDITRFYRDRGYARARVVPQTQLDPDTRIVHITVQIQRGPKVYIERIDFSGNTKTRDEVLRRELRIIEGQLYNQSLVELSKERITALGYFETVEVAETAGDGEARMVLDFQIAEKATGTFQLGAGFSSQETFLLTGQIQQQNLFGRGQTLSFDLQLSGIRQLAQVRFVEPYLYGTDWTTMVDVFKILQQQSIFDRDSTGASLTMGHPILASLFDDHLRLFANYRIEYVKISAATGGIIGGTTATGQSYAQYQQLPLYNLFRNGLTSSLRLSLQWDTRNNRLFPSKGIFATLSSEAAESRILGSDTNFLRHRANFRFYQPLLWQFVLKFNSEWGLITSSDDQGVPIYERYFLGGITDVRGYRLRSIGPRVGQPANYDPLGASSNRGINFGGNMQLYYNLELEFPLVESVGIKAVLFHDAGNAWNMEQRLCGPEATLNDPTASTCGLDTRLRTSWGFGLRWFSPLGPLRFEWGFPFNRRSAYENPYEFQFMVGNAF